MKLSNQDYCHSPDFKKILIVQLSAIPFIFLLIITALVEAQNSWWQVTVPSVREAAASFKTPPSEYGAIHWAIWGDFYH